MMRMMTRIRSILIAALLVAIAGPSIGIVLHGRIVGVVDGDTADLITPERNLVRIRLSGIDAPEKHQPFGNVAKKALSDLAFGRSVRVEGGKQDRYGRLIGKIVVNGADVNLQMVKRGYAWHYIKYAKEQPTEDRALYSAAEALARAGRLGIWENKEPIPPWEFRSAKRLSNSAAAAIE